MPGKKRIKERTLVVLTKQRRGNRHVKKPCYELEQCDIYNIWIHFCVAWEWRRFTEARIINPDSGLLSFGRERNND
ncbi:hypothetical protein CSTERTH_08415 [Thermoclostridium stercorarium subsp. thermolacticum DSM 2910]|uniref:Uncharacterized protein n=2 Tax=Thermoclostridium stercorarium TaxID=1510 RepID=A0A1B1YLB4_THEST|nr:hypothetical protein CSTERTH_08415 [Thermoclostridium stercorarium subsp. thermolacticum DSM 2910]ANX01577.1 hypothetical protein CSTERLE_08315 [Thermoclostridium stercorarium subsp. leptospartum DSM 9219]